MMKRHMSRTRQPQPRGHQKPFASIWRRHDEAESVQNVWRQLHWSPSGWIFLSYHLMHFKSSFLNQPMGRGNEFLLFWITAWIGIGQKFEKLSNKNTHAILLKWGSLENGLQTGIHFEAPKLRVILKLSLQTVYLTVGVLNMLPASYASRTLWFKLSFSIKHN